MKRLLIALALFFVPTLAQAQCNGVFPNNTVCGNITGANNTPRPTNPSAFLGSAGGSNGQVQYNNNGVLGGLTNAQLTALINPFSSILSGAVPASAGGTANFLRADGTWDPVVTTFNSRTGAVVPAFGDYGVSTGGTGVNNLLGFIAGLQPAKLTGSVISVNPGTWANNLGTLTYTTTHVLTADLSTTSTNCTPVPALGAQVSGALDPTSASTDGTEVFLYLFHCTSNGAPILLGSSSDIQLTSQTFTATATSPGVITTGAAHGLRKRMAVYVSNTGGALPSPLGTGIRYFVCTIPSTTSFTLATSIANVNSSTCLTFTTTGSGTNTATWGAQADADFSAGSGVLQFDRGLPYFAFVWSWSFWGGGSGVPGGTNGIPDFQTAPDSSDTILTDMGQNTAFQALATSSSASYATLSLSPWLANINRRVKLFTVCQFPSTAGGCFISAPGSNSNGLEVGSPAVAGIPATGTYTFQTDSNVNIQWKTTGSATLSIYVIGWSAVDPR